LRSGTPLACNEWLFFIRAGMVHKVGSYAEVKELME